MYCYMRYNYIIYKIISLTMYRIIFGGYRIISVKRASAENKPTWSVFIWMYYVGDLQETQRVTYKEIILPLLYKTGTHKNSILKRTFFVKVRNNIM